MIFYDCATAPSPRRTRMAIGEKGVHVETRQIDLRAGEHRGEAFLAVNPRATVPVLITEDGVALTENAGIAAYLEALQPEPALLGRTPTEKGLVATWNAVVEQNGFLAAAEALRNSAPGMAGRALTGPVDFEQIPALAERGRTRLRLFFDLLQERLEDRAYLAIDGFSVADITGFVTVAFAERMKFAIPESHGALRAWFDRVAARPSAQL